MDICAHTLIHKFKSFLFVSNVTNYCTIIIMIVFYLLVDIFAKTYIRNTSVTDWSILVSVGEETAREI